MVPIAPSIIKIRLARSSLSVASVDIHEPNPMEDKIGCYFNRIQSFVRIIQVRVFKGVLKNAKSVFFH